MNILLLPTIRRLALATGVLGAASALGTAGGAAFAAPPDGDLTTSVTPALPAKATPLPAVSAADAANRSGFALFQNIVAASAGKNVFVSPTSISLALALADNGAAGETRTAISKTLSLPTGANLVTANADNDALMKSLTTDNADNAVTLSIANALWADDRSHFAADYAARCQQFYAADVRNIPFHPASAAATTINHWVAKNTHDKITSIIAADDLPKGSDAVLTNAIYFKGKWTTPFRKEETSDGVFHRLASAGGDKTVPMMRSPFRSGYLHTDDLDAVRLPYGTGRFAFYAMLPAENSTATALAATLTVDRWHTVQQQLIADQSGRFTVVMPRFKIAFDVSLKKPLSELGMGVAFTREADFRPMGLGPNHISDVLHKAVLEVNEEGSEAAAATAVIMSRTAAFVRPRILTLDRPFLCAIVDDQTGAVLFAGVVNDPE